jgi:putative transposase
LKEVVAELMLENRLLKRARSGLGGPRMRYPAAEKLEIIRLVEQSSLPVRRSLEKLGLPRATFYRWYDRDRSGGPAARPGRTGSGTAFLIRYVNASSSWHSTSRRGHRASWPCASPERYFVSEASVYRLLKARDLIASPAFIVIKTAAAFKDKTTAPNQLWQTDFTYLKGIGWAGSTSRLCSTTSPAISSPGSCAPQ